MNGLNDNGFVIINDEKQLKFDVPRENNVDDSKPINDIDKITNLIENNDQLTSIKSNDNNLEAFLIDFNVVVKYDNKIVFSTNDGNEEEFYSLELSCWSKDNLKLIISKYKSKKKKIYLFNLKAN